MIIYNHNDPFSSLWWMYGSVIPQVAPLSVLAAFHGVVAVYFKENYNLFVTNTTHTILSSTVGFLLLLKATLCYRHYGAAKQTIKDAIDCIRTLAVHVNSYGVVTSEDQARSIVKTHADLSKHIVVMWYSFVMHLRRQPVLPKNSRITLYLYPDEQTAWTAADVRPLYNLMQIGHHIARLRDKGILSDGESVMIAQEVKILTQIFGTMEAVRDMPTLPFVYYQFCNWIALAYCLTVPAAIATHDTYYTSCSLFSFFTALAFLGINQMGNLLQEPYGLGPNDMPMERWGQVLEHELYQLFPWFKFRFEGFPLFVDDLEIMPPDDPRARPKKDVLDVKIKSNWVPARNKILAAMRLGNPRLRKFREAKVLRETMVKYYMLHRRKQEQNDMASLIAALAQAGIGGAGAAMGKKGAKRGDGKTEDAQGAAADAGADSSGLPKELAVGRGRKARAPAELAPKSALVKQATVLQKRFPESETLQRLMQQMVNPRVPDADKNALLALMNAEAEDLAAQLGVDIK